MSLMRSMTGFRYSGSSQSNFHASWSCMISEMPDHYFVQKRTLCETRFHLDRQAAQNQLARIRDRHVLHDHSQVQE